MSVEQCSDPIQKTVLWQGRSPDEGSVPGTNPVWVALNRGQKRA